MNLRQLTNSDTPALERILAEQGMSYPLPDLRALVSALAIEEGGELVVSAFARPTVEVYFVVRPNWKTPAMRMQALEKIHEAMRRELRTKGFEDAHAWIPPEKKSFISRLVRSFGWMVTTWTCVERSTAPRAS